MSLAEAAKTRELTARVESLEFQVKDLCRRLDDFSKAERAKEPLSLKKANG